MLVRYSLGVGIVVKGNHTKGEKGKFPTLYE